MAVTTLGDKRKREGMPDILDAIAAMSSDAVPTPPVLARAMLDLLPEHVWSDPTLKWLDPAVKSGSILREIASRLMDGLAEWEPDVEKRANHVLRNMVYGVGITRLHAEMGRRSVYVSRDATGPKSLIEFSNPEGNIPFVEAEHDFPTNKAGRVVGQCSACGAPPGIERGEDRENYAYAFIHGAYPTEELKAMKFDVIVGNPPYQTAMEDAEGNKTANILPLYHRFIERAIEMNPKYLSMIVPSRWFNGGKGLDDFRAAMIADRHLSRVVDNPKVYDCFPGVKIRGGVNFFLWDRDHDGDCTFSVRIDGRVTSTMERDLRAGEGVVIRDNLAATVIDKVISKSHRSIADTVSSQDPFGQRLKSNYSGARSAPFPGSIPLVFGGHVGHITEDEVQRNHAWIPMKKVLLPKASSGDTPLNDDGQIFDVVLGEPIGLDGGAACTQTYLVAGTFDTSEQVENFANYLATKFVRFLVLQRKSTQNLTSDGFIFVPEMDVSRPWTDPDLYSHFGLSQKEIDYIEATIKVRSVNLDLESPVPTSHLPGGRKYRPPGARATDAVEDDE